MMQGRHRAAKQAHANRADAAAMKISQLVGAV